MRKRKRLLLPSVLLLALLVYASQARAGRIFLLIAADTSKAGGIALSTGPDTGFMFDVFYANVPGRQLVRYGEDSYDSFEDGDIDTVRIKTPWKGPDIRNDLGDMGNKLLTAIDNCPAGPDDTIVFFYTGHGAHDTRGHYLLMPDQKTTLSRQTIVQRIRRKNRSERDQERGVPGVWGEVSSRLGTVRRSKLATYSVSSQASCHPMHGTMSLRQR